MPEQKNIGNNKRIAKNTLLLYFRMLFLMLVSLYTSRVVLDALGVSDYGIYNVVGGFVSMFALVSAALTSACSRFLNFEMGKGDITRQNVVFSTAVTIQWTLAIIVFLLAEIIGVWYVNNVMVIPQERLIAANWCFQFSVFNFCMNIVTVPYNASIIAHEKMKAFAFVSIYEGLAKLFITFLVYRNPFDRLIFYALMLLVIQFSVRYAYQYYCRKHFEECHYKWVFDKILLMNMLSYSVWHLIGNGAVVLKTQGVNVVLNIFFGTIVNAARGIAVQVNSAVTQFVSNFIIALNPQITQSYARGDMKYMLDLIDKGARFSFYLLFVLSFPIILNTRFILAIWLKTVPDHTVLFTQLMLVTAIITTISNPLITAQNATGNVRNYQLVVGCIQLLNLPLSYIVLKKGFNAESVFYVAIIIEIVALFARIFMLPQTIHEFRPWLFLRQVGLNVFGVCIVALPIPVLFKCNWDGNFGAFLINITITFICTAVSVMFIGCNAQERTLLYNKVLSIKKRIINNEGL